MVASDIPESRMSVKSCVGHVATSVAKAFDIRPNRMLFVEFYPRTTYGKQDEKVIPERFEAVEFSWLGDKAVNPKWRELEPALLDILRELMREAGPKAPFS